MEENLFNNNNNETNQFGEYNNNSEYTTTNIQGFNYYNNYKNNNDNIDRDYKNEINMFSPSCLLNIKLYNGETVKPRFNYSQTVSDIYYYIKRVTGFDIFIMQEGFPPQNLNDYEKTIGELRLDNTIITQRLN